MTKKTKKKAAADPTIYPIQHWSTSSMMDFLSNGLIFKKRWVLLVPDEDSSMSAMIGRAAHLALQTIFGGNEEVPVPPKLKHAIPIGIQTGLEWLDKQPDIGIRYGKTGSREQMLEKYARAIQWYTDEMPDWDVVTVEEKMQQYLIGPDGTPFAIPMKGKSDLIVRKKNGRLSIIDHKFVSSYTDPDAESAAKIIQAMFLFFLVKETYGEEPEDIVFRECKVTENRDGTVQTKEWGVVYDDVPHYKTFFYKLYDDCTRDLIRPDAMFLPNLRDPMNGDEALLLYQQDLLGVDMTDVVIDHNTHNVRFMPKETKFAESVLSTVDAESYLPQERIRVKLAEFGVPVKVRDVYNGPSVTLYTFEPSRGVSVKRIEKHSQDIGLALRSESVRIIAPIPNTNLIGIEVPREDRDIVMYPENIIKQDSFEVPIGVDLYGKVVKKDLRKMPHLLIAGATGSGKSIVMKSVIHTLTNQHDPSRLKLVLIDPKQVELSEWEASPHLHEDVIYSVHGAVKALDALVLEMENRYKILRKAGVRSIDKYGGDMPYILVVIDEFADLIMSREKIKVIDPVSGATQTTTVVGSDIETAIIRLAQKGRASGIHLMIGTQRPSVNVITGLIKANIPTRIALMTTSMNESKVILDTKGAEELLGDGDMLFLDPSVKGLQRLQGFFIE